MSTLFRVNALYGWESDYPDTTHFEVGIKEGCGLGNILSAGGDTAKYFQQLLQPIRFVAVNPITGTDSVVVLRVGAPVVDESGIMVGLIAKPDSVGQSKHLEKSTMSQSKLFNVNEKMLAKTSVETSCTVYTPIYNNTSETAAGIDKIKIKVTLTGANTVWPYKTSGSPITNAKIKVTNGDQPLANENVKIAIKRIDKSGGHDHPNSSNLTLWGRVTVNGVKGNPVTAYTDQNGEITTEEIRSSEFGGEYIIEAALESKLNIKDTVHMLVKVLNLLLLPNATNYVKVGGTEKHYGPLAYQVDNNHWININAATKLIKAAIDILIDKTNNTGKLRINDISLPSGGLFDFRATWQVPHGSHRTGKDVDIENKNLEVLKKHLSRNGWIYIPEGPTFYPHFRFIE